MGTLSARLHQVTVKHQLLQVLKGQALALQHNSVYSIVPVPATVVTAKASLLELRVRVLSKASYRSGQLSGANCEAQHLWTGAPQMHATMMPSALSAPPAAPQHLQCLRT
jgi:hypothetical protein